MKIEIVSRKRQHEGIYLVQRIDHSGRRFEIEISKLTRFGSHDPESELDIQKRIEFERFEELLKEKGCAIEKMEEDGNCFYRAVARQVYGDPEKYQKVRDEVVDHVITHKSYFSSFDTDIDKRLSEQLINCSWGGNLEIQATSELYNVVSCCGSYRKQVNL